ncbi:DUF3160 domain-containing protein [Catenibacillus scindens]|uniref:DUF3160 domain-containing protein n=1 Tax=Catenibacillus scindens TaxID=673271 RepID=UPI003209E103
MRVNKNKKEGSTIFCVRCGKKLRDGAKFCPACGYPVQEPDSQGPAAQDQVQNNMPQGPAAAPSGPTAGPSMASPENVPQGPSGHRKKTGLIVGLIIAVVAVAAIGITAAVFLTRGSSGELYARYMDEGESFFASQDYEQAEKSFLKAIDEAPDNKEAYFRLADVYSAQNKKSDAARVLQDAVDTADMDDSEKEQVLQQIADLESGSDAQADGSGTGDSSSGSSEDNTGDQGGETETPADTVIPLERPLLIGSSESSDSDSGDSSEVTPSVQDYSVDADLSNVYNRDQFYIEPGSEEARLLSENLFYVEDGYSREFFETYESNRYSLTPNFVTVDSMMHTYHLYFSYLMKKTERDHLADMLSQLSQAMLSASTAQYDALKGSEWENAARRNVAFFAVGASLQSPDTAVPGDVADVVSQELSNITGASGISNSALTGTMIDYSQFAPRGYYSGDQQLEQYFRAMMWYGQIGFIQSEEDLDRSALLMTLAMNGEPFAQWSSIYVVTSFFAGSSDDLTYYEYLPAIEAAYGGIPEVSALIGNTGAWEKFHSLTSAMDAPAINSIPTMDDNDPDTKTTDENKGFRFMGQRFTIDAAIFQQLIYDNVQENSSGEQRMLPDTLDVAAALGSDKAYEILQQQGDTDYVNYPEQMEKLRTNIASASTEELWDASLYSNWLYTLTPLLEEKEAGYPSFMRTDAWATKNLESFAGSYAELKHDTVLYAKQVMAEMGGGELPQWDDRGYVEPEPEVWKRFANLASKTSQGLKSYGLLSSDDETNLARLEEMARQFLTMTEKELSNTLLTDEEYDLIRNYGGNLEHFWLEAFKEEGENITSGDFPAAIVTDIATDPNGSCLEVATGNPSIIYVIVPIDGELHICVGAVYSFYQFEQPLSQRLTDDQWRQMMGIAVTEDGTYNFDSSIQQPEWTQSYRYER